MSDSTGSEVHESIPLDTHLQIASNLWFLRPCLGKYKPKRGDVDMDWSQINMDRLYELYTQHFSQLKKDIIEVNVLLGSAHPEKTWMKMLSRKDYEMLIKRPIDEPGVVERWIRTVIRGNEHEFPGLKVA